MAKQYVVTKEMVLEIVTLYAALFGRAPDADGLGFWSQLRDQGQSLTQIANTMYSTTPARAYYPSFLTNSEIVEAFYRNVLGRSPDTEGLAFWTGQLNAPGATPGSVITTMINVVLNYSGTDAAGVASKALLYRRVELGYYYAVDLRGGIAASAYVFSLVNEDPLSLSIAKQAAEDAVKPPTSKTLPLTVTNGDLLLGGGLDDVFIGTAQTTQASDVIDGASGNDTLRLESVAGQSFVVPSGLTVRAIEALEVNASGSFALDSFSGIGLLQKATVNAAHKEVTGADSSYSLVLGSTANPLPMPLTVKQVSTVEDGLKNGSVKTGSISVTASKSVTIASEVVPGVGNSQLDAATIGAIRVKMTNAANAVSVTVTQTAATPTWAQTGDKIKVNNGTVLVEDENAAGKADKITQLTLANYGSATFTGNALATLTLSGGASEAAASGDILLKRSIGSMGIPFLVLELKGGRIGNVTDVDRIYGSMLSISATNDNIVQGLDFRSVNKLSLSGSGSVSLSSPLYWASAMTIDATKLAKGFSFLADSNSYSLNATGGDGADVFDATRMSSMATMDGGAGNDVLKGSLVTNASLSGGLGDDTLVGGVKGDYIDGGIGTDTFNAEPSNDSNILRLVMGEVINLGATSISAAAVKTAIGMELPSGVGFVGTNSTQHVWFAAGDGVSASDTLTSIENVIGTLNNDYIVGSAGANTIMPNCGADYVEGGAGADTFVQRSADSFQPDMGSFAGPVVAGTAIKFSYGVDVIVGFNALEGDRLDLASPTVPQSMVGKGITGLASGNYYLPGAYDSATKTFTVGLGGADTLVMQVDPTETRTASLLTNPSGVVLVGANSTSILSSTTFV